MENSLSGRNLHTRQPAFFLGIPFCASNDRLQRMRGLACLRYVTEYFLHGAMSRGHEVGQFLGGFSYEGQPAIRYLGMRADESWVVLSLYEKFDPLEEWYDVASFSEVDEVEQGEAAEEHHCESVAAALALAERLYGARPDRWVNEGILDDEYRDYSTGGSS